MSEVQPGYGQKEVFTNVWRRIGQIVVENPIAPEMPSVFMRRDEVKVIEGVATATFVDNIVEVVKVSGEDANITESFPIRDIFTNAPTGAFGTYAELMQGLFSLGWYLMEKKDAATAAAAAAEAAAIAAAQAEGQESQGP